VLKFQGGTVGDVPTKAAAGRDELSVAPGHSLCQEFSGHQGPQGKQGGQPCSEAWLRKFDPSAERGKFQMGVGIDEAWDNGRGAVIDFSGPRWAGGFLVPARRRSTAAGRRPVPAMPPGEESAGSRLNQSRDRGMPPPKADPPGLRQFASVHPSSGPIHWYAMVRCRARKPASVIWRRISATDNRK